MDARYWIASIIFAVILVILLCAWRYINIKERLSALQKACNDKDVRIEELQDRCDEQAKILSNKKERGEQFKQLSREKRVREAAQALQAKRDIEDFEVYLQTHMGEIYQLKESVLSETEQRAYYFFQRQSVFHLEHFADEHTGYYIFPQINVSAFVQITDAFAKLNDDSTDKVKKQQYNQIIRKITSKSVDFLVCKKVYNSRIKNWHKDGFHSGYQYRPVLVIEFDGPEHKKRQKWQSEEDFTRKRSNDAFKDTLFHAIGINCERKNALGAYSISEEDIVKTLNAFEF
jgi:hypothetical protein